MIEFLCVSLLMFVFFWVGRTSRNEILGEHGFLKDICQELLRKAISFNIFAGGRNAFGHSGIYWDATILLEQICCHCSSSTPRHFKYDCGPRLSVTHMMLWLKRAFHCLKIESVMTHDFSMSLIFLIYVLGTRETVIFLPNNDFFGWFWGVPWGSHYFLRILRQPAHSNHLNHLPSPPSPAFLAWFRLPPPRAPCAGRRPGASPRWRGRSEWRTAVSRWRCPTESRLTRIQLRGMVLMGADFRQKHGGSWESNTMMNQRILSLQ